MYSRKPFKDKYLTEEILQVQYLNINPPIVAYTYSQSIANKIFNHNKVVEELDFDVGIKDMK